MKRRSFLQHASVAGLGIGVSPQVLAKDAIISRKKKLDFTFSMDENRINCYVPALREPVKIFMLADTHLFRDDARGEPFSQYSGRMAGAYNSTRHFQKGTATNPEESFELAIRMAKDQDADMLALLGDIFSFPSEAAVEWVMERLNKSGLPYFYVAGNHDWHYEGMEGTSMELRKTWIEKRLLPLYQGNDPMMAAYDVKGITVVAIDNSVVEILPEQLAFFQARVKTGKPLVLMLHIPLYAPGRNINFGCGNPNWGAKTDTSYKAERRPQWPEAGHTKTTMDFHKAVFSAPNLLGVVAGHIHRQSVDIVNGIPQFVADDNASSAFLDIRFFPKDTGGV